MSAQLEMRELDESARQTFEYSKPAHNQPGHAVPDWAGKIYFGDCLDQMKKLPDNSIDLIITSPPYADARKHTYGGVPPNEYVEWFCERAEQMLRILSPAGSFVLNTRIQLASAICSLIPENTSLGVLMPRHFSGRLFSLFMAGSISLWVMVVNSPPFGKYCRMSPLVFSFRPRSHEA